MGKLGRIDQFSRTDELLSSASALLFAIFREWNISVSCTLSGNGPIGLSYREQSQQTVITLPTSWTAISP